MAQQKMYNTYRGVTRVLKGQNVGHPNNQPTNIGDIGNISPQRSGYRQPIV